VEVTGTGAILILLGCILFFVSHRWIYILTVFFIPFTGTALINFPSGFWLQPFQFFGILWILGELARVFVVGKVRLPPFRGFSIFFLILFVGVVALSTIMPIIIDGKILVQSTQLFDYSVAPLEFTHRNITTPLYILFGVIVSTLIATRNSRNEELLLTLRVYGLSGLFVSIWGWLQFICYHFDIPYPYIVFNNTTNITAHGFTQIVTGLETVQTTRISSVAAEPSVFAQYLLTVVPIFLYSAIQKQPLWSRRFDRFVLFMILSVLLLSTSSSAYIGLVFLGLATFLVLSLYGKLNWKIIAALAVLLSCGFLVFFGFPVVREFVQFFVLSKLEEGSGLERILTILYAWEYFREYPILGVGWGSVISFDLIVNLLSNSGVLGFTSFFLVIFYSLGRLIRAVRMCHGPQPARGPVATDILGVGLILSLTTLLLVQMVAGFWYGYGYFWFILGMVIGVGSLIHREHMSAGEAMFGGKPA
jgi:hypothetical protein